MANRVEAQFCNEVQNSSAACGINASAAALFPAPTFISRRHFHPMVIREERGIMSGTRSCTRFFKKAPAAANVVILRFSIASHQQCRFLISISRPRNIQREVIMNLLLDLALTRHQSCNIHISGRMLNRITILPGSSRTGH